MYEEINERMKSGAVYDTNAHIDYGEVDQRSRQTVMWIKALSGALTIKKY